MVILSNNLGEVITASTKIKLVFPLWTSVQEPLFDPHIAKLEIRGRVGVIKEVAQPLDGKRKPRFALSGAHFVCSEPDVCQAKVPIADKDVESSDSEFEVEERYGLYPRESGVGGAKGPLGSPLGASVAEEACQGRAHTPDMDDDIPLFRIAMNLERREKSLCQCLACGGIAGDTNLLIRPEGQGSARPTFPLPTSRGTDMASRLRDLSREPSSEASSCPRAKVTQITRSSDVAGSSLPLPPLGKASPGQPMIIDPPLRGTPPPR
uniref:Uncharacterized protein n=1 Tax=Cannabis sativa TaxID=3483 RepID=A0A803QHK0_CANSA